MSGDTLPRLLEALAPLHAPALRRLSVRDIPDATLTTLFAGDLHRITSLTIGDIIHTMPNNFIPTFSMLTRLRINMTPHTSCTLAMIQEVLAQTPLLEDLAIVCFHLEIDRCRDTPVVLPALKKIGLGRIDFSSSLHHTHRLFSAIIVPALECLALRDVKYFNDGVPNWGHNAAWALSLPGVHTLILAHSRLTPDIVHALPAIERVMIRDYYDDIPFWTFEESLQVKAYPFDDTSPPCPSLRYVTAKVAQLERWKSDLTRIAEERAAAGCPFHAEVFPVDQDDMDDDNGYLLW
ncbi:hypothetical protein PLICRDRAFT_172597 [Plicaturopsis crispa FD-325 SS-3]|nr:hypothetical protein PLICRDRAFT_172597 [Plicaturopsis crispa FD-325 SS-3]